MKPFKTRNNRFGALFLELFPSSDVHRMLGHFQNGQMLIFNVSSD